MPRGIRIQSSISGKADEMVWQNAQRRFIRRLLQATASLCLIAAMHVHADDMTGQWREARKGDRPEQVLDEARNGRLPVFDPGRMQVFPTHGEGAWVVLRPLPPWVSGERVLSIRSPGMGRVTLYDGRGGTIGMALDDFGPAVHGHGRLVFDIPASLPASSPLLVKFEPSSTLSAPVTFRIDTWPDYLRSDAQWLAFAAACFAVMLAMAAMALCFALMLRDMTFAWYAGYLLCYSLIQGYQTGFLFHPLELKALAGTSATLGVAAVAMSVSFAALFMTRFAVLSEFAPLLRMPVLGFAIGMPVVVLLRVSGIDALVQVAQTLINPLLILGALLLLVASAIAAVRGSRHAWFFLAGWTPLLILTALCSAQMNGVLTDVSWLPDAALAAGAFEAIVLSIGLADRALTIRRDRDRARVLADSDALTGVLNRRAFTEVATEILGSGTSRPAALLFFDLDRFKELNDCQGHAAGDRALVAVAAALRMELRPSDLLARYGGEEFVALLQGVDRENAMQVATRLCRRVHRLDLEVGPNGALLTVSIGMAMRHANDTVDSLVERADTAMYAAKLAGRNRVMSAAPPTPVLVRKNEAKANPSV
ncbi:diguanylate cyclase (GGDEF)-like protein [Luteibacter rhizovicinus]|uniref:diguanylate cyclase n=1 Tax=Luteibacter rhizovicinus TaxID=242606 RepID=A0A4R3YZT2_9GAMM|nr:diguanylate cyclase [Luteibacter rhizovicinus]TCV97054.1 diguanylate cyclase (GGDEF)-like protein [Luteibacter rhizovicinus]